MQARAPKRKRGASKAFLAVAKQSTLSPEQRQITSFFGQGRAQTFKASVPQAETVINVDSDPEISSCETPESGTKVEKELSQQHPTYVPATDFMTLITSSS